MAEILIGVDEAGMGPWAGPLTAGVVVLAEDTVIPGVKDSKKLKDTGRENLVDRIHQAALFYYVNAIGPGMIDIAGITQVWNDMIRSLAEMAQQRFPKARTIIDGNKIVPNLKNYCPVVKADDKYTCVSAASILAKYHQCGWMDDYHLKYPEYGFDRHRGYGTPQHKKALEKHGPCPAHRKSYKPIKRLLSK